MSQTVIFSVGIVVFALTVWGAVMAGGIWLGQLVALEDGQSLQKPVIAKSDPDEVGGAPIVD
jgi:hypothetical protein